MKNYFTELFKKPIFTILSYIIQGLIAFFVITNAFELINSTSTILFIIGILVLSVTFYWLINILSIMINDLKIIKDNDDSNESDTER